MRCSSATPPLRVNPCPQGTPLTDDQNEPLICGNSLAAADLALFGPLTAAHQQHQLETGFPSWEEEDADLSARGREEVGGAEKKERQPTISLVTAVGFSICCKILPPFADYNAAWP
ncbi:hypothetical protein niasHS_014216 [Heterodera schachtii]|uniref:Uncharacterized protein n=1 Tax=Heterodera schachtii TaxID=97005 RepID=A0ABD2IBE0_HETSC